MVSKENLTTYRYDNSHYADLNQFCIQCGELGYTNNSSLQAIKLEWCLDQGGQFFLTYYNNTLICISGCHPLPQAGNNIFRLLFRGIELPEYRNIFGVTSKTHMASIPFYYHTPLGVEWARAQGASKFVITTNWSNPDGIASMSKSHRVFQLLARQQLVSCLEERVMLFETEQSIWELNLKNYFLAREGFKTRNGL